ncbi:hypothetical protein AiwAL_12100 [Acidiphilium sp. AL]|uniref:Uncharacterized protein n=1 Tax=Acidiphilium iwatense TaxID=768198 RepID=A0ABS9DZP7_9PROT|nr:MULTISPECIES: hypothetical protein [Acidiphilium]MCF3946814.1 hypothetical protein [Acidiphilium iwatense]MCU4160843.1 hypothetical protein [Acidiphilium sp. AL]
MLIDAAGSSALKPPHVPGGNYRVFVIRVKRRFLLEIRQVLCDLIFGI